MTPAPGTISITAPLGKAFERVGAVLFRPFDATKWFVIGFCAWLAYLAEGGGFGGGFHGGGGHGGRAHGVRHEVEQARDFVVGNLAWIIPVAAVIILFFLAITLLIIWLSSRGRFMFLHCVANNVGEVRVPWYRFSAEGNSLFVFRIVLALISMVIFLPLIGGVIVLAIRMAMLERVLPGALVGIIGLVFLMILAGIAFWVIGRLVRDFVVPIQFLRRSSTMDAWRETLTLFRGNYGNLVLYLLFRILLSLGISTAVLVAVFATCCLLGCLLILPYIGTVALLPVLVLERSYSLYFLAQYGADYDVFKPAPAPATS